MTELFVAMQFACTVAACWALVCRLSMMSGKTLKEVRRQHASLLAALLFSLVLPAPFNGAVLALGVVAFLAYSSRRWHRPEMREHITKPADLDENFMHHISGGKK